MVNSESFIVFNIVFELKKKHKEETEREKIGS